MTFIAVRCPHCHSEQVVKRGKTRPRNTALFVPEHRVRYGEFSSGLP